MAGVIIAALAGSVVGLFNDFAQDDIALIGDNIRVHSLGNWREFFSAAYWPPPFAPQLYRPLSTLAFAIEHAAGFGAPIVFRVVSYALYAAVCVGVLVLARRLMAPRIALAVALLFAAHPVHVEAVALAVGQSEMIVALLAIVMVLRYTSARQAGALRPRDWIVLAACYTVACLVKETGFVLPALLVAAELFLVRAEKTRAGVIDLARGFGALALIAAALLVIRSVVLGGFRAGDFTAEALMGLSAPRRALTMLQVVPRWLELLVWPAHLQLDYSPNEIVASTRFGGMEFLGLAILFAGAAVTWLARRRAPVVSFGIAWCAVALLPVSNVLIPSGIMLAERTLFLPSIGFLIAVGGAVDALLAHYRAHGSADGRAGDRALLLPIFLALVVLGVARSGLRERDWRNDWILWARTARDAPRSYRAQRAYGEVLMQIGQRSLAIDAYTKAIAASPFPWLIQNELAARLRDAGDDTLALDLLNASLREKPDQPTARAELVADLIALGRYDAAAREASSALAAAGPASPIFRGLFAVADSAERAHAPAGSVRMRINTAPAIASPP